MGSARQKLVSGYLRTAAGIVVPPRFPFRRIAQVRYVDWYVPGKNGFVRQNAADPHVDGGVYVDGPFAVRSA